MLLTGCSGPTPVYPVELRQLHRNLWNNILDVEMDEERIDMLLETLTSDGQWPGIEYGSKIRGAWPPRTHLANLLDIAVAYQTKTAKYYHKKEVSAKIHRALNHWLENDYVSPNWWHPEIGTPMLLAPIMVLMEAELSAEQIQLGYRILERSRMGMTGQNKVWLAGNVLFRALLKRDADTVRMAGQSIREELVVSTGEGVQPDWSYHQHGPQLQFGNYGLSYVNDMIKWISILRNTPFQLDESKVAILRNYVLKGQQWVTWKHQMDISACGRQLFIDSPERKAATLSRYFTRMETLDPPYADAYRKAGLYETLSGHKHFWRSDFQVWRNPGFYISVKMCSERVIGAESCNAENLQGYYMGDGATFLYQSGEEYRNIFPFFDWKKIPGTTTIQDDGPLPVLTASGYRIGSDFVGGVSDGVNGIAAMDYQRNGLKARKSWFMLDGKIICLGAGISSNTGLEVTTGINQAYLAGEVYVKTGQQVSSMAGRQNIESPAWILHDHKGYLFPAGGNLVLQAESVEGSWNWVAGIYPDERMKANLFRLWIQHGRDPQGGSYAYVLFPEADQEELEELEKDFPYRTWNCRDLQAVLAGDGTMMGIVFYQPGRIDAGFGVGADKPCMMMLKKIPEGIQVSVSDPTQKVREVRFTIEGKYGHENATIEQGKTKVSVMLPQQEEAGSTLTLKLRGA